ncbi:hypothetical protein XPA_004481 [Xanthoria parietina]
MVGDQSFASHVSLPLRSEYRLEQILASANGSTKAVTSREHIYHFQIPNHVDLSSGRASNFAKSERPLPSSCHLRTKDIGGNIVSSCLKRILVRRLDLQILDMAFLRDDDSS